MSKHLSKSKFNIKLIFIKTLNRKDSNVNIVKFCKQKDNEIEEKFSVAEEAKEMYKQFLNENLAKERKLREQK